MCVCVQATHRIHFKAVLTMRHAFPLFKHIPILQIFFHFVKRFIQQKTTPNQGWLPCVGFNYFVGLTTKLILRPSNLG